MQTIFFFSFAATVARFSMPVLPRFPRLGFALLGSLLDTSRRAAMRSRRLRGGDTKKAAFWC